MLVQIDDVGRLQFEAHIPIHLEREELRLAQKLEGWAIRRHLIGEDFADERMLATSISVLAPFESGSF